MRRWQGPGTGGPSYPGSAYTAWRQRQRHTLRQEAMGTAWVRQGRRSSAPSWPIYDALVARFGVAADERFTAVLNSITKAAAVQCGVPHPPTDRRGGDRRPRAEGGVHEEVSLSSVRRLGDRGKEIKDGSLVKDSQP